MAVEEAVRREAEESARVLALRDRLITSALALDYGITVTGFWEPGDGILRLPGNAHLLVPGCEGDSLLYLLDAAGVECSTGSACQAGVPQPSHVLLAMGIAEQDARGALRLTLGHTSTDADVDAFLTRSARCGGAGAACVGGGRLMRVVAAMSGGVDSAVAAARMLDAGHEVVGVHLALSQSAATLRESARGCCTIEDAGDARRVADMLGIPFYVWDMAARFKRDVMEDFVAEYAAGRTPNPCLRCNEKIKFAALLDKALALGFDAVATGHYAQIVERAGRRASCTARSTRPRTSPTSWGCSRQTSWLGRSSPWVTRPSLKSVPRQGIAVSTSRPSLTRTTSASSLTATPGDGCRGGSASSRATSWMRSRARWSALTPAPTATPSGSAVGSACPGTRRTGSHGMS